MHNPKMAHPIAMEFLGILSLLQHQLEFENVFPLLPPAARLFMCGLALDAESNLLTWVKNVSWDKVSH